MAKLRTFEERFEYLKLSAKIGESTFGFERHINQVFYRSPEWKRVRREIILRDDGCDLGCDGLEIFGRIEIHHINPITIDDIENREDILLDPNNLICISPETHKALHFGDISILGNREPTVRKPNDTCPWKT